MSTQDLNQTIKRVLASGDTNHLSDEGDVRRAVTEHQQEFPYEREEEAQVTRREFCNFLALTSTALFVSAAGFAAKSKLDARGTPALPPARIDGAQNLAPNSSLNFRYPNEHDTAILVRTGDGNYYAYGQKCTHLACPVYYEQQRDRLECPCHEGGFEVRTGNVIYGPPPRPLDRIKLEVREGGEVWAVGREAGNHESHV